MKRASALVAAGLLAGVSSLAFAGGALAAESYPFKAPSMTLSGCPDIVTGVNVQIADLKPASTVTTTWVRVPPANTSTGSTTATANSAGTAATKFIPSLSGNYSVTAVGVATDSSAWTGNLTVTVLPTCVTAPPTSAPPVTAPPAVIGGEEDTAVVADTETVADEAVTAGLADTGGGTAQTLLVLGAGALLVGGTVVLVSRSRARGKADAS